MCRLLQESQSQKDSGPHYMVHGSIDLLFCSEFTCFLENFLELHNKTATTGQSVLTYHLFKHLINDHKCSFGPERGWELKGLLTHETGNGGFTNLLGNYNNVPIVEFMRDVLYGIFLRFLVFHQLSHIFIQLYVNLSQPIH